MNKCRNDCGTGTMLEYINVLDKTRIYIHNNGLDINADGISNGTHWQAATMNIEPGTTNNEPGPTEEKKNKMWEDLDSI